MSALDKRLLSERDICTKYVTLAIGTAGWDVMTQVREEVYFTKGRVIVQGKTVKRGEAKRADYLLHYISNLPIAIIEVKDNNHSVGDGMQQALDYGTTLDVPFVFSANGDAFLEHDRTVTSGTVERELPLAAFPSPVGVLRVQPLNHFGTPLEIVRLFGDRDKFLEAIRNLKAGLYEAAA